MEHPFQQVFAERVAPLKSNEISAVCVIRYKKWNKVKRKKI